MNLIISLEAHLIYHHQKDYLFHLANHRRYLDLYHSNFRQIYSYYFSKKYHIVNERFVGSRYESNETYDEEKQIKIRRENLTFFYTSQQ